MKSNWRNLSAVTKGPLRLSTTTKRPRVYPNRTSLRSGGGNKDRKYTPPFLQRPVINHPTQLPDAWPLSSMTNSPRNNSMMQKNITDQFDHDDRLIEPYSLTGAILTAIPVIIIILIIVAGNAMVIAAVLRDPRLKRQLQNWLIVSLAVADALVGLLIMPLTLTYELLDEWVMGDLLCELWLALDVLFVTASILNLCAISIDRYCSLTDPLTYAQKRTSKRMAIMILIVWLSAFSISFPPLVGWRPENRVARACFLSDQLGYVLYSSLGSFFVPTIVLLFVYARIYLITKRRSKKKPQLNPILLTCPTPTPVKARTDRSDSTDSDKGGDALAPSSAINGMSARPSMEPDALFGENDYALLVAKIRSMAMSRRDSVISDNITSDSGVSLQGESLQERTFCMVASIANEAVAQSRSSKQDAAIDLRKQLLQRQKLVRKKERQATLVLGLVLGAFIGSWLPFFSSYVSSAVGLRTPDLLFDVVFWLGYCNSGLNAFIYNFFNPDFRRAFRRILKAPLEKLRSRLLTTDQRRSSTASVHNGHAGRTEVFSGRKSQRRGAVFSPRHPYLQIQQQKSPVPVLVVSPYDNLDFHGARQ